MFNITNKEDARHGYEILRLFFSPEFQKLHRQHTSMLDTKIVELKQNLRKWAHAPATEDVGLGFEIERRTVRGDYDSYIELVKLPEEIDTAESASEFFYDFIFIDSPHSMFDCTGKPFTAWYKVFNRHGRFFAYHCVGLDV